VKKDCLKDQFATRLQIEQSKEEEKKKGKKAHLMSQTPQSREL
jgi:hypothetical protein